MAGLKPSGIARQGKDQRMPKEETRGINKNEGDLERCTFPADSEICYMTDGFHHKAEQLCMILGLHQMVQFPSSGRNDVPQHKSFSS